MQEVASDDTKGPRATEVLCTWLDGHPLGSLRHWMGLVHNPLGNHKVARSKYPANLKWTSFCVLPSPDYCPAVTMGRTGGRNPAGRDFLQHGRKQRESRETGCEQRKLACEAVPVSLAGPHPMTRDHERVPVQPPPPTAVEAVPASPSLPA